MHLPEPKPDFVCGLNGDGAAITQPPKSDHQLNNEDRIVHALESIVKLLTLIVNPPMMVSGDGIPDFGHIKPGGVKYVDAQGKNK